MTVISNGTNLINNGTLDSAVPVGKMTLIKTLTASNSATLSFVHGSSSVIFDDTYDKYVFKFYNIHPATDNTSFAFQADTGTNTNYNQTITSTTFRAYHIESGSDQGVSYVTGEDQTQATGFQKVTAGGTVGNDNDQSANGYLEMYNPSSGTFMKHFIGRSSGSHASDYEADFYVGGYVNTTTALTRVQFKVLSGNFDGVVKLYGIGE